MDFKFMISSNKNQKMLNKEIKPLVLNLLK